MQPTIDNTGNPPKPKSKFKLPKKKGILIPLSYNMFMKLYDLKLIDGKGNLK